MIGGRGRHTGRELVRRLRSELRGCERQNTLLQVRLRRTQQELKTQTVQREIADGLVLKQATALQAKNERIAELEHRLQSASEDTVETPIPAALEVH